MSATKKRIIIIGAGINGLVAANYLARAGFLVTILERKDHAGGACTSATCVIDGKTYEYPQGASVLGFMEDFVFKETGLAEQVHIHFPTHPEIVYIPEHNLEPAYIWADTKKLKEEIATKWGEKGDVLGFLNDMKQVVAFLRKGYKDAVVPTLQTATVALGQEIVTRWITGSAKNLLDYYFTSDAMKLFYSLSVIESGPVSFNSPYSAFSIPLMASGSIFGGQWGYVKGGIWQIPIALDKINETLGVKRIFSAQVLFASPEGAVRFEQGGAESTLHADYVLFATDPVSAAKIANDIGLLEKLFREELVGTSGKLILFFKKLVEWKDDRGEKEFGSAFRFIIPLKDLEDSEKRSNDVVLKREDFTPGLFEIYCEGAGDRELGGTRDYELVSVFFKNLAFGKHGAELPHVRDAVRNIVLSKVQNPEDCFHAILETPKDLAEMFFFPRGNIDDVELSEGQTFFQRTYSPEPKKNFYQFGNNPRFFYSAAGSYPCGSVAGTPGYMCAKQIIEIL
ncbi:MAG TPA: FAD-dependent oxidoreductase [Candidatus Paceibacterota bacterium]